MTALSVLDLVMIGEGKTYADAIEETRQLARHVEQQHYSRYWIAEHHDMPGIGSAATSLVINEVANATRHIRVGAGGIMLPNHAPLVVAEQFGTLDTLHPGASTWAWAARQVPPGRPCAPCAAPRQSVISADIAELRDYLADNGQRRCAACRGSMTCRSGSSAPACSAPTWRPGWACLCLRLALRPALPAAGRCPLPRQLPALGATGQALCDGGHEPSPPPAMPRPTTWPARTASGCWTCMWALWLVAQTARGYVERLPGHERAVLEQVMACTIAGGPQRVREGCAR
jgi:hypothetical protein